jgi:hypothetical protein
MLTTQHHAQSSEPDVLAEILRDDINLAVWARHLSPGIALFSETLLARGDPLSESRVIELQGDDLPRLPGLAAAFARCEGHAEFVEDVAWLTQAYGCLLGAERIGLRLRILDKAMCPRYHVDWVSVRLITTYAGRGSEWLEEGAMAREGLGNAACEPTGEPGRLQAGDVALFKGERWEGNEGRGIIHRSPQVESGERRLIMTLDWLK